MIQIKQGLSLSACSTGTGSTWRTDNLGAPLFHPITIGAGGVTSAASHPKNNYRAAAD